MDKIRRISDQNPVVPQLRNAPDLAHLIELEECLDVLDAKQALAEPERISWEEAKTKLGL